jgi:hypothetical protein
MSAWFGILYLACAGMGLRLLFAVLGRRLAPLRPRQSDEIARGVRDDAPSRPPLGDYRT